MTYSTVDDLQRFVASDRALVRLATWPDRFNEWISFNTSRLAPLGHMTSVHGKPVMTTAQPTMSQGTTAAVELSTTVEMQDATAMTWVPAVVMGISEDQESLLLQPAAGGSAEAAWVQVNSRRIRLHSLPQRSAPQKGTHRRSLSHLSGFESTTYHKLSVDIKPGSPSMTSVGCTEATPPAYIQTSVFTVYDRYTDLAFIGNGAYGVVCSAIDSVLGTTVAIKRVAKVDLMDNIDSMRTLRELLICKHLRGHENIVKLLQIIPQAATGKLREVTMVFEWMATDLTRFMRSGQLTEAHIRGFGYQILRGLKYFHTAGITHRDLKPANILVNPEGELKIADFGLAIGPVGESHTLISYVVTRPYRAPELLLDHKHYTSAIDMWSFGCIVAEMLLKQPLFTSSSVKGQLDCIVDGIGTPTEDEINAMANPRYYTMLRNLPPASPKPWSQLLPRCPDDLVSLVEQLLCFMPALRRSSAECLRHPAFEALHLPSDEPDCMQRFTFMTEDCEALDVHALIQEVANNAHSDGVLPTPPPVMVKSPGALAEESDIMLPTDPFATDELNEFRLDAMKQAQEQELSEVANDHDAYMASLKSLFLF